LLFLSVIQRGGSDENKNHLYGTPPLQMAQSMALNQVHGRIWKHGQVRGFWPSFTWRVARMVGDTLSSVCCGGHRRPAVLGVASGMSALWKYV
jgi:hypothetical protein